ncbi:BtpA/SgcQ family protein [Mesorhizobium sp. B2-3-11]|uniref:BtpA/SgcQ family protein n=1 Tax=Mesorhizobium sp. B2-3-11 TaxID=2589953 RepID=UPI001AEDE55B|nr:BtpA/SgcQ family protein [Mesorhizobium sp. B2-3-11]
MNFLASFKNAKPILAMLHLKGVDSVDKFDVARREVEILWTAGVDAVIVENYFGSVDDVVRVCDWLAGSARDVVFGVNILKDDKRAFEVAKAHNARFIQLDSVAGHLPATEDRDFGDWLAAERAGCDAYVLGGVRFKYQPYLSGRSLEEDLLIGKERCDGIVVTGDGTGLQTPTQKTREFRDILGPKFPLVVGAGVTPATARQDLACGDAVIVGSYLKAGHIDTGEMNAQHVRTFVETIRELEPA